MTDAPEPHPTQNPSNTPRHPLSYTRAIRLILSDDPAISTRPRTGPPPNSASSSPRSSKPAASPAPLAPPACRGPVRMRCATAWPARRSTINGPTRSGSTPRGSPIPSAPIRSPRAIPLRRVRPGPRPSRRRRFADAPPSRPVAKASRASRPMFRSRRDTVGHASRDRRAPVAPVSRTCRVAGASRVSSRPVSPQPAWFRQLRREVSGASPCSRKQSAAAPPRSAARATALRVTPRRSPRSPRP